MRKSWLAYKECRRIIICAARKNILKKINIWGGNGLKSITFSNQRAHLRSLRFGDGLLSCLGERYI